MLETGILVKAAVLGLLGTVFINFIIMLINSSLEIAERKLNYKELSDTLINPPEQPLAFYASLRDRHENKRVTYSWETYGLMAPGKETLSYIYFDEYGAREEIIFDYSDITIKLIDKGSLFSITKEEHPYYFTIDPVLMRKHDIYNGNKVFYAHLQSWIKKAEEHYSSFQEN